MQPIVKVSRTREIPNPTYYIKAIDQEYAKWAFNEERALLFKGKWRNEVFGVEDSHPLDLEIGTGNGYFFAHRATTQPQRCLLGIELKYKPLIQSIRRALRGGAENARIMRYDASYLEDVFAPQELNDVFIHFPDPWERRRQQKNRLIQTDFLDNLFELQRPGSMLEFKTDSRNYFDWAMSLFEKSRYKIVGVSYDLHNSPFAETNFMTHFEQIFLRQNLPIHYCLLRKEV